MACYNRNLSDMKLNKTIATIVILSLFSCKSKTPDQTQKPNAKTNLEVKANEQKEAAVVVPFFKASGNNGSWSATVSPKSITIKTSEKTEELTFPYKTPLHATEAKLRVFRSASDSNEIEITVTDQPCNDNVDNEPYRYEIFVKLSEGNKENNLSGCGVFVADKSLNTVWTLEQLNGKTMTPENFGQELPYMDIHTEIGSFTGFGGCNRMKGTVGLFEPGTIFFSNVIATKMMCVGNNQERIFVKALQTATSYQINNNKFCLSNGTDVVLILKK